MGANVNVNVLEARNRLSSLLRIVEENPAEVITINRRGVAVADLVKHDAGRGKAIRLGIAEGKRAVPSEREMAEMDAEIATMMGL